MAQPTSRVEIADLIENEFDGSPRHSEELITAARDAGARQRGIETLSSLPDTNYVGLSELWQHLPEIQIEP